MTTANEYRETMTTTEFYGEVISKYTRKQAIEDGVLYELPDAICKEAGFKYPIAATASIHALYNGKDEGVLWDILTLLRSCIQANLFKARQGGNILKFTVKIGRQNHEIKGVCGPGDDLEPVITLMLPDED